MNRKKAIWLTDAYIEHVKDELIKGHNSLTLAHFNNLINAGYDGPNAIPDEDIRAVLRSVATGCRTQTFCYRSAIVCNTTVDIDRILDDLVLHEVFREKGIGIIQDSGRTL